MMKTKEKNKGGRPKLGDEYQKKMFHFRTTDACMGVWNAYADNLGLTQTELFYKLVLLVGALDTMMRHYEKECPEMIMGKESDWQTLMMIIKCCDNITTMNNGREKQYKLKQLDADKVRNASDILHNHFATQFAKKLETQGV